MTSITLNPGEVKAIPVSMIIPDPNNPRKTFNQETINQMAASLKAAGQLQAITVRAHEDKFMIVTGERRWRGAVKAKLETLNCSLEQLKDPDPENHLWERTVDQLIENMQREDLNDMDLAESFAAMMENFEDGLSSEKLHKYLKDYGLSKAPSASSIRNLVRLNHLPDWAKCMVRESRITAKHARVILQVNHTSILDKLEKAIEQALQDEDEVFTASDMEDAAYDLLLDEYPRASRTYDFKGGDLEHTDSLLVFYDPKALSKKDQAELNIVDLGAGFGFITNLEKHKELNTAAAQKILASKEQEKKAAAEASKKSGNGDSGGKNIAPREKGLTEYLEHWLRLNLEKRIDALEDNDAIFLRLVMWRAFLMPTHPMKFMSHVAHANGTRNSNLISDLFLQANNVHSMRCFLHNEAIYNETRKLYQNPARCIAEICIEEMDLNHRAYLANHLGIDLHADFTVDDDYLKLYTKDGLIELAKTSSTITLEEKTMRQKPTPELRDYMLENLQLGCPTHLLCKYNKALEEYNDLVDYEIDNIDDVEEVDHES